MTNSRAKATSVLLVSQYFPPDITAAAFRIGALAEVLHNHPGLDLHVLTSEPNKLTLEGSDQPSIPEDRITRVRASSKSHLLQYLEFMVRSKLQMRRFRNFDWVFVTSPPLSTFLVAYSPFFRGRLMLDVRDLWPDTPVAAGKMKEGLVYRFFKIFEKWMYSVADEITAVSRPMADYIREKSPKSQVSVVYNGVPRQELEQARSQMQDAKPVVSRPVDLYYAGNIGLLQGLEIIPRALALAGDVPLRFHIIGAGVLRDKIEKEAVTLGLKDRLIFHSPMPRGELVAYLEANADALFVNLKRHHILEKTIPSKVFDCLLLQKPILTGIRGEGREILARVSSSLFFDQDSPDSLAKCLRDLSERAPELTEEARRASLDIVRPFVRENQFHDVAARLAGSAKEAGKPGSATSAR